jgi:murein DD-endopeptidase MepM/ murein hydrolase activator NlpD
MKFLFKPVKNYWITQKFGEDEVCVSTKDYKTTTGKVKGACPIGTVSLYKHLGMMRGHTGLDITAPTGTKLYASQNGFIEEVQTEVERGLGVGIITDEKFLCDETDVMEHFKIRYWHLQSILVKKGQKVKIGDLIGLADNTGYSSGSHLHFELKPVAKDKNGRWFNVLQDNGFFGAVDAERYMEDIFALDFAGLLKKFQNLSASIAEFIAQKIRGR